MPIFEKCPKAVADLARSILNEFADHSPLVNADVKIDLLFARADRDEKTGEAKGDALKLHGVKALGIARAIKLKDRVKGMGDCEISLDGDWWDANDDAERRALLDHELSHFIVACEKDGITTKTDDIGRPVIKMRQHNFEFGWFTHVAARHGQHSLEVQQAKSIMDNAGQCYWPQLFETAAGGTMSINDGAPVSILAFNKAAAAIKERHAADRARIQE